MFWFVFPIAVEEIASDPLFSIHYLLLRCVLSLASSHAGKINPLHRTPSHLFRRRKYHAPRVPQVYALPPVFTNSTVFGYLQDLPTVADLN
jgi:hypothetical protein